jgi:PAS domain S-box-containing protein
MPGGVAAAERAPASPAGPADGAAGPLVCADDLPDGLVVADHAGRVTVFNRAASRLTGVDPGAALGRDVRDVLPLRDAEGRCWWTLTRPYQGLCTRSRHPERSLYLPDGTEFLVSVGYVRDRQGEQGGQVRRLAITLRDSRQRLRAERSRADLVSTVAHELRSPLTSVKGFTATLLTKWPRFTDDQKRVMLETVNADADRVTRLITELLDVSRIESGRIEVHRELVDIAAQARKVIAGRVAAGEPEDKFRVETGTELPETWLDADKIFQILANLIENAVRHGAGTVAVMVQRARAEDIPPADTADAPSAAGHHEHGHHEHGADEHGRDEHGADQHGLSDHWVSVAIRDQGQGIAPELAPRVFGQFWRAKRRGGAGLGLFIVKGLVEAHGGMIAVHQAPGGGAEFRFTMPAGRPDFG